MDNRHDFLAAFDLLHRELRLRLRDRELSFLAALDAAGARRILTGEERRFLDDVRDLRNFHAHAHDLAARRLLAVEYAPALVERIRIIACRVGEGTPAKPFMIRWRDVLSTRLAAPALPLMAEMLRREISHAPVVEEGLVVAIFDERAVFESLATGVIGALTAETEVGSILIGRDFDAITPEEVGVDFVLRRTSLPELRRQLDDHARARDRISLAIVTENGRLTEAPLGLLTIWDIPQVD